MTSVDLSHSAHHVTTEFVLPVLEDADSIQITLGQIMRMIVCRQVDTKSAGLLLYALQIASTNLRRTRFEVIRCGADALVRERILCSANAS